jgi:hypothetical protein
MWMNSRGFLYNDAYSRATHALLVLYSSDPHLGAIGFVWMPLPVFIELLWVAFYPIWPQVVSSGFASTFTTALAGGATAALLLYTARRLGLSDRLGWVFALLVSANPMLFLYGSNGLVEGFAAPFLIGAVCALILFWYSGQRRYVTAAAMTLALGFASLEKVVPYGAMLFTALVLGVLWRSDENRNSTPQGRWRAVEGVGILFLVPSLYVAALWIGANAVIMKDPLYFVTSEYANYAQTAMVGGRGLAEDVLAQSVAGDALGTLRFVAERTAPFLIPGAFLLLLRVLDGRFWKVNTLSLVLLLLSVPLILNVPTIYLNSSYGSLRYFIYPLFVAAGWGLYEVALSEHPRRAAGLVLAGWIIAAPVIFLAMTNPVLGRQEHWEVEALLTGKNADDIVYVNQKGEETSFPNRLDDSVPVVDYLQEEIFPKDHKQIVAMDVFAGTAIVAQIHPEYLRQFLVLTPDRRFESAVENPRKYNVSYLLIPRPYEVPQDAIVRTHPKLWAGEEAGFELTKSFPDTTQEWRLYEVVSPEK